MPVAEDHVFVDEIDDGNSGEPRRVDLSTLSQREREVLDLALAGLPARVIAERLWLTEATVRSHLSRIHAKLGVAGRVELLAQMNSGVVPKDPPSTTPSFEAERRVPGRRRLALLGLVLTSLALGIMFAWRRPDLPASTDLASVSRLLADRQVASLDLRGDTLFVTTLEVIEPGMTGRGYISAMILWVEPLTGTVVVMGAG